MQQGAPILIVSYIFPPFRGIGGRRWAKFAKGMAVAGHRVHVIHCKPDSQRQGSFWTADVDDPNIITHPLPPHYPSVLARRPLDNWWEKVLYRILDRLMPLTCKGNHLDRTIYWKGQLRAKVKQLRSDHGIEHVIATGAPFRLLYLLAEMRVKDPSMHLTVDFRDPWTWEEHYGQQSLSQSKRDQEKALEKFAVENATKVISSAPAIIDHLKAKYGGPTDKFECLRHPVDPDELVVQQAAAKGNKRRFIYAGSTYDTHTFQQYFSKMLDLIGALKSDHDFLFELYISGDTVEPLRSMVAAARLDAQVEVHPAKPINELASRIATASGFILFAPESKKDVITTKFSELLYLQCPLIHIGPEGVVSRHVEQHGLGISMRISQMSDRLPVVLTGKQEIPFLPDITAGRTSAKKPDQAAYR